MPTGPGSWNASLSVRLRHDIGLRLPRDLVDDLFGERVVDVSCLERDREVVREGPPPPFAEVHPSVRGSHRLAVVRAGIDAPEDDTELAHQAATEGLEAILVPPILV